MLYDSYDDVKRRFAHQCQQLDKRNATEHPGAEFEAACERRLPSEAGSIVELTVAFRFAAKSDVLLTVTAVDMLEPFGSSSIDEYRLVPRESWPKLWRERSQSIW